MYTKIACYEVDISYIYVIIRTYTTIQLNAIKTRVKQI